MNDLLKLALARSAVLSSLFTIGSRIDAACEYRAQPSGLKTEAGFIEFIQPEELKKALKYLPTLSDGRLQSIMTAKSTMWYDEGSMVFMYQDSVEVVVGNRANCVGRDVGVRNQDNPGIAKLMNYFGPDYRFRFPFRKAAGTDDVVNSKVVNFWAPPMVDGKPLPVRYWAESGRGRWRWVFPKGTVFGELLLQKSPAGEWYPFEVRTRERYLDGWAVNMFRPFLNSGELAGAIKSLRPSWESSENLKVVVNHLSNTMNLQNFKLESVPYRAIFETVVGALDVIPAIDDAALVSELLTKYEFRSAEGKIWKEGNGRETYGPASSGNFSIVPAGYTMGMFPVNEVSCNRCHSSTGKALGDLEFDIQLYGEIWGEDRIFTWHPFEPNRYIFGTYDVSDFPDTRKINPRMTKAGLLLNGRPASGDANYKVLPK